MFATWNRLFKQKQERMNKFTKSGQGKLSGLPTGKLDPLNKHHLSISRQNNGSTTMRLCCSHQIRQAGWFGRPKRHGCQAQAHHNRGYAEERSNVYRLHDAQAAEDHSRQSCYWKTARRFALQCIIQSVETYFTLILVYETESIQRTCRCIRRFGHGTTGERLWPERRESKTMECVWWKFFFC